MNPQSQSQSQSQSPRPVSLDWDESEVSGLSRMRNLPSTLLIGAISERSTGA